MFPVNFVGVSDTPTWIFGVSGHSQWLRPCNKVFALTEERITLWAGEG